MNSRPGISGNSGDIFADALVLAARCPAALAVVLVEIAAEYMIAVAIERRLAEALALFERLDDAEAGFADIDAGDLDRLARARRRPRRRCPRGSAISKKPPRSRAKPPKRGRARPTESDR
jgi:hypothetical protein